jgi:hypothetical protein
MLLLSGCLVTTPLWAEGGERSLVPMSRDGAASLPLPPVPHLDKIPWLTSAIDFKSRPNVDAGLTPKLDSLGRFLIDPVVRPTQFSAMPGQWEFSVR